MKIEGRSGTRSVKYKDKKPSLWLVSSDPVPNVKISTASDSPTDLTPTVTLIVIRFPFTRFLLLMD